jgi:hypothetical protein
MRKTKEEKRRISYDCSAEGKNLLLRKKKRETRKAEGRYMRWLWYLGRGEENITV